MTVPVSSPDNPRVKLARALLQPVQCRKRGAFLVEGPRFLQAAGGCLPLFVLVSLDATVEALRTAETLKAAGAPLLQLDPRVFRSVSSTETPQGIAGVYPLPRWTLEEIFRGGVVAALDGVADPGNTGTVIRSAAAFRADGVVCLPGTAFPWGPKATRASAGHNAAFPVKEASSLASLKQAFPRYCFIGASPEGTPLEDLRCPDPLCLVVGSESRGLSSESLAVLDGTVSIPMAKSVESLNAGVSASILLQRFAWNCTTSPE